MEPVKPLLKSDKIHMTAGQTSVLSMLYDRVQRLAPPWKETFSESIAFTPTQSWIDKFLDYGMAFYPVSDSKGVSFAIRHYTNAPEAPMPVDSSPWVPKNGEAVLYPGAVNVGGQNSRNEGIFIAMHNGLYVVGDPLGSRVGAYSDIWPKPKKTQVPLAELLSVYASVKGLTQDGVELKPEN